MLHGTDFHADSEYHIYFGSKLSFHGLNADIRVKIWAFAPISTFFDLMPTIFNLFDYIFG
jgi:hypothetical protein